MKLNKLFIAFYLLLFLGGFLPALAQDSGKRKHIILVLDTSFSVSQNRMVEPIQAIVKEVLSRKKTDDVVSILTFSTRVSKRVDKSKEDAEDILKEIKNYNLLGGWTFTSAMLKKLVQEISREENKSYAQSVFILSDGLDDPPTKSSTDLSRFQGVANIFYIRALTENANQEALIRKVFPQANVKVVDIGKPLSVQKSLALLNDNFTFDGVVLQFPVDFKLIAGHKKVSFKVQILSDARLEGKRFIFKAEADNPIFKQQIDEKEDFDLQSSTKLNIQLQEGVNSFTLPYFIAKTEAGKSYNVVFSLALAQDAANPLLSKDTRINVVKLTLFEKFYQLPVVFIVLLFIGLAIILFILYRVIRYQLFKPLVELTYWYEAARLEEPTIKTEKSRIELSNMPSGKYVISSKADAFLVLPNLSTYDELVLIKKGKKFKTRVRIHPSSLRNLEGLSGGNIRKRRIRNGTSFKLGRYTLSFRTNL